MDVNLKAGDLVIALNNPEWGQGKVLFLSGPSKAMVFFLNEPKRKTMQVKSLQISNDPPDPIFANLDVNIDEATTPYFSFEMALKRFFDIFPQGFDDPAYLEQERNWKVKAHEMMVDKLDEATFRNLLNEQKYSDIVARVLAVESKLYLLLAVYEKMALRDALKDPESQVTFANALYEYLYGEETIENRFKEFADVLSRMPQQGHRFHTWPIQTLFLFTRFPNEYPFMKPEIVKEAAKRLIRYDLSYRSEPNWSTYRNLLNLSEIINAKLSRSNHPPRDMIDVQSFIYAVEKY